MSTTLNAYKAADFVHVVDGITGEVMKAPVPKNWIGTDLLPPGSKKATKSQLEGVEDLEQAKDLVSPYGAPAAASSSDDDDDDSGDQVPAGNASREDWVTYAKSQGASDEDLVVDGQDLTRDQIRAKYVDPAS